MSATQLRDRAAWLEHLHGCPECKRRDLCAAGLEKIAAMRAGMAAEESLDLPRIGLVHAD